MSIPYVDYWLSDYGWVQVTGPEATLLRAAPKRADGLFDMRFKTGKLAYRLSQLITASARADFVRQLADNAALTSRPQTYFPDAR